MKLEDFKLEIFFGKHEFTTPYLLAQSDCEAMSIRDLLSLEPEAEAEFLNGWLGYTEEAGNPELRRRISELYDTLSTENIVVHVGAQEAIFNFMNVLLDKGDHVISQFPTYQSLFEVANSIGCEVSKWSFEQGENGWVIDINQLEKLIKPNTKLIVLNSPNNPTGYALNEKEIAAIVKIARRHGIYVFCDEVYKGIELDGLKRPWFADCYEKGVSLGVMSKAYGLAGLRIGWLATADQALTDKLIKMKQYTTICSSAPAEFLAMVALKHGDQILRRNRNIIEENLKTADAFFKKYPNRFEFNRPMAGSVAFVKMNIAMPIQAFCEMLIKEKGVLLLPADVYSFPEQYFRMGFGRKGFAESLAKFDEYLDENQEL